MILTLDTALKAEIPMVGVSTTDPVHAHDVLQSIAGGQVQSFIGMGTVKTGTKVMWTQDDTHCTTLIFNALKKESKTLIFLNCKPNSLIRPMGTLQVPAELVNKLLAEHLDEVALAAPIVKGMNLKDIEDLFRLSSAHHGFLSIKTLKETRSSMGISIQGLYPVDTDVKHYEPLPDLESWVKIESAYFLSSASPPELTPRGILLEGPPGTGKTLGAKYIASALEVPLYRLDVGTTLSRYIGEAEARLAESLARLDTEAPCVVLFDEVEKMFGIGQDSNGVIERMIAQFLWWLQSHTTKVFVVMTTNDLKRVPEAMYRPGRIDRVVHVPKMTTPKAIAFGRRLIIKMVKTVAASYVQDFKIEPLAGGYSAAAVSEMVYEYIKSNGLIAP